MRRELDTLSSRWTPKARSRVLKLRRTRLSRAGATIVNARRLLNRETIRGKVGPIIRETQATDTSVPIADTEAADDVAMSDPFVAHAATIANVTPTKQATEAPAEGLGVYIDSVAFTFS